MVNDSYYDVRNHLISWAGPETAFRTNAHGKDTANQAGDTFFRLPGRLVRIPYIYIKRNKVEAKFKQSEPDHL